MDGTKDLSSYNLSLSRVDENHLLFPIKAVARSANQLAALSQAGHFCFMLVLEVAKLVCLHETCNVNPHI